MPYRSAYCVLQPSDEGPETTTTEITFEFRTYGPMQVVDPDPSIKHYPFEAFSVCTFLRSSIHPPHLPHSSCLAELAVCVVVAAVGIYLSQIRFTNVIDAEEFDEERDLVIEPPIEDLRVVASGTALSIHGRTKGRTTYNVTIKETVKDTYGQVRQPASQPASRERERERDLTQASSLEYHSNLPVVLVSP